MGTKEILELHKEISKLLDKAKVPNIAMVAILEIEKHRVMCTVRKGEGARKMAESLGDRDEFLEDMFAKKGVS